MKILFVQGGSRWKYDADGGLYTDSNFSEAVWARYREWGDLTVLLRREDKVYPPREAMERFNRCDTSRMTCLALPDLYRPGTRLLNPRCRRQVRRAIAQAVREADRVIVRSPGNFYTNTALACCRRYRRPYLVEVTGFAWEGSWYHSLRGKMLAPWRELRCRALVRRAPWAVYVTRQALQKRYPCRGRSLGCSDVELAPLDEKVLAARLEKIQAGQDTLVLGTAGFLDVAFKGQRWVIEALALLRQKGNTRFRYQLAGAGSGRELLALAQKLGVADQVEILGSLPRERMNSWYDGLDIYIHPSDSEGLCRSIAEAMSRAVPVACSRVGGNPELASPACLFGRRDPAGIAAVLELLADPGVRAAEARRSLDAARAFECRTLDRARNEFYQRFLHDDTTQNPCPD